MIYAFIIITFVLLIVVEIFTVLLRMTGVSEKRARFQVISMLTGVGYTTHESETIVSNPVRRAIAQLIILLGYTSSVTLISLFVNLYTYTISIRETYTVVIYCISVLLVVRLKFIKVLFDDLIEKIADNFLNKNHRNKLHTLSHHKDHILSELTIITDIPILNIALENLNLKASEIQILNIERNGVNKPNPIGSDILAKFDKILVFGNEKNIRNMFKTFH